MLCYAKPVLVTGLVVVVSGCRIMPIVSISCRYPVVILSVSCRYPVVILLLSCRYPVVIQSLSSRYPVVILSISCVDILSR